MEKINKIYVKSEELSIILTVLAKVLGWVRDKAIDFIIY